MCTNKLKLKWEQPKPKELWRRANFKTNNFSPGGLYLVNSDDTAILFKKTFKHKPDYFLKEMAIDIREKRKINRLILEI